MCGSYLVTQGTQGGDQRHAEVALEKFPEGGDGFYDDTDRCTWGGIR